MNDSEIEWFWYHVLILGMHNNKKWIKLLSINWKFKFNEL